MDTKSVDIAQNLKLMFKSVKSKKKKKPKVNPLCFEKAADILLNWPKTLDPEKDKRFLELQEDLYYEKFLIQMIGIDVSKIIEEED